jgi:iron complex outermembrane receptor protein
MWTSGIFWKGLPTSAIERVEVMRGPGSALFGADASAGVINVITKTAAAIDSSEAGVRLGSFNTHTGWVRHGTQWNGFAFGFTAEASRTDGHDPLIEADRQTSTDQAQGTDVSLAPGRAQFGLHNADLRLSLAKGHWRLLADYMRHSDLEIGLTGAGVLDPVTRAEDTKYNVDLIYANEGFGEALGLTAKFNYSHLDYSSGDGFQERPPGFAGAYPDGVINQMRSAERRWLFETSGLYSGLPGHAIRLGAGHVWQDLYVVEQWVNAGTGPDGSDLPVDAPLTDLSDTPYAFAPEKTRTIDYLFLQDEWDIAAAWALTLGARYDRYSDFGSTLNPRLALVWQTTDRLTTKLMYGQAFRAPSYQELFAETSFSLPNPDLEPERSRTVEVAFSYAARRDLLLSVNAFDFNQSNIIQLVAVPGLDKAQYRNVGDHTILGVELEGRWQATERLQLYANYTVREPSDDEYQTYDQPNQDGYLRADFAFAPGWHWNLQNHWIGERERRPGDARAPLADYWLTDTTLRYSTADRVAYALSVRNLFDSDAREPTSASIPADLPLPERNYYAEVRFEF